MAPLAGKMNGRSKGQEIGSSGKERVGWQGAEGSGRTEQKKGATSDTGERREERSDRRAQVTERERTSCVTTTHTARLFKQQHVT